jgi:voltage-gated potassium channel
MQESLKRVFSGVIFFIISMIIAIIGYMMFGWTLLESVYMVVITIFGVGYGEVRPLETSAEKIFTMGVILAGTSSAVYGIGGFVSMITEGEINKAFSAQRQKKSIEHLNNHVIICGFGHIGQVLAQQLKEAEQSFVVIDIDNDTVEFAQQKEYLTHLGDATDENSLTAVGIERAKVLVTVLPTDATNLFITLTARELNKDLLILARGEIPSTEKKLKLAGADHVILPAAVSGSRIANLITRPTTIDFLGQEEGQSYLNDLLMQIEVQIDELTVSEASPLIGKTVRELEIRGKGAFIIIALRRKDGELISHPHPSFLLNSQDTLIVLGHQEDLPQFARYYRLSRAVSNVKNTSVKNL